MEEFDDLEFGLIFGFVEEVGDEHLTHPQHAPPPRVAVVVGGVECLLDMGPIGQQNVLLLKRAQPLNHQTLP